MNKFPKKTMIICLISMMFIALSLYYNSGKLTLITFFLLSLGILIDDLSNKINYLLFFVSWVYVLKLDLNSQSLYSFLLIIFSIVILYNIIKRKIKIPIKLTIVFILLFVSILFSSCFSNNFRFLDILNFFFNYLTIYLFIVININNKYVNYENYLIFYITGILSAGVIGYIAQNISVMFNYLSIIRNTYTEIVNGQLVTRFSGLDLDPNYFSIQVLIAISLIITIGIKKKFNKYNVSALCLLIIMGFLTASKMFLIGVLVSIIWIILQCSSKDVIKVLKYASSLLFIILILFLVLKDTLIFDTYLKRLSYGQNDVTKLTTGRSELWKIYFTTIVNNIKIFFIGTGISSYLNGKGAHNIYLMMWYKIGIVGIYFYTMFILSSVKCLTKKVKINKKYIFISILPIVLSVFENFALDSFNYNFFPMHILICIVSLIV